MCIGRVSSHIASGLRLSDVLTSFDELRAGGRYPLRHDPPRGAAGERGSRWSRPILRRALAAPGSAADPELRPRDEIMVFNLSSSRERIFEPDHP